MELKLNHIPEFINVVGKGMPKQIELLSLGIKYGTPEYDIAFGRYEKHNSFKKMFKNIKQILWQKN